jgi:hypothetical protein
MSEPIKHSPLLGNSYYNNDFINRISEKPELSKLKVNPKRSFLRDMTIPGIIRGLIVLSFLGFYVLADIIVLDVIMYSYYYLFYFCVLKGTATKNNAGEMLIIERTRGGEIYNYYGLKYWLLIVINERFTQLWLSFTEEKEYDKDKIGIMHRLPLPRFLNGLERFVLRVAAKKMFMLFYFLFCFVSAYLVANKEVKMQPKLTTSEFYKAGLEYCKQHKDKSRAAGRIFFSEYRINSGDDKGREVLTQMQDICSDGRIK